ncbi:hypothetical protein [Fodinibius sp. SL11]|uniref:hypothetical protein n=1 Tax=Fodinibius sp. SL11 TaxID=3425690 RepID=UPI003F885A23
MLLSKTLIWLPLLTGIVLSGCSHTSELFRDGTTDENTDVAYSVIYYIHADADYLYHDAVGEPVRKNQQVLDTALNVADEAESGEVFIFYQRPEKKFLGLFPRKSSRFYHYTNGEKTSQVNYRHPNSNEDFFTTESRLYNQYRTYSGEENQRNFFLYFGHEIPDDGGNRYHQTLPNITVNTETFSSGIQKFVATDDQWYDLIVLSTCNNGTPEMAANLMPFSHVMLASPQNLHLSHIDSQRLDLLESSPRISSFQLADSMANQTYQRLEKEIQTAITLSVYELDVVKEYQNKLHTFTTAYDTLDQRQSFSNNIDCKFTSFFDEDTFEKGVKTWYNPARFGRNSSSTTHSGWGCTPLKKQ